MPIYVYERADGSRFEIRQGFHDDALTTCPDTDQPVRRVINPAPVIFKGSGWYINDSRPASSSESSSSASSSSASSASGASEAKPAESKPAESKPAESKSGDSGAKKGEAAA
jgi:putative FmdB family regulatory protein